jgi:6-phosphogluconolactonase (cycloisomerase 2 family)
MRMKFRALVYLPVLISLGCLTACSTKNSSSTGGTGALFVTTQGDSLITPYTIDLSTGKFTVNGKAVATDSMPSAVVLSPKGDALFVANSASNSITAYAVNSDGTLTAAGATPTQGTDPVSMAIDSAGHLFVVNEGSATISIFNVSGTGLMGPALFSTVTGTTGTDPSAVAITSNGKFLYITDKVGGTVTEYNVDASGNLFQPVPYSVGTTPDALIITDLKNGSADTSNFLYVANFGSNNVSGFSICDNPSTTCTIAQPNGALTPVAGSPFPAQPGPVAMALDPSSKFLYLVDEGSNLLSQYRVSTGTGVLTSISPGSIGTGTTPVWVAVRAGSTTVKSTGGTTNYVYVANSGSGTISIFSYDSTIGQLGQVVPPVSVACFQTQCGQPSTVATK